MSGGGGPPVPHRQADRGRQCRERTSRRRKAFGIVTCKKNSEAPEFDLPKGTLRSSQAALLSIGRVCRQH